MPGYREITIPGGTQRPRAAPARARRPLGRTEWRAVLVGAVSAAAASCRNSPGTVLGSLAAMAAAGFICFNALGHQSGRHPAPILPKVAAQKAPAPRETAAEPGRDGIREIKAPPPAAAPKQAARDAIGDLIRSDETTASVTPRAEAAKAPPKAKAAKAEAPGKADDAILRAQRALSKLGYAVKPDGALGPGTRAAIEKFERGAKLPVTGEAAGRTLRELVSRAGQG